MYEVIKNNGKEYRLVHAGLTNFSPDKALAEYDLYNFLEEQADYSCAAGGRLAAFCIETEEAIYVNGIS